MKTANKHLHKVIDNVVISSEMLYLSHAKYWSKKSKLPISLIYSTHFFLSAKPV